MRMEQGVRTGLGHGGITCVSQTQFSSFFFFFFTTCPIPYWWVLYPRFVYFGKYFRTVEYGILEG